MSDYQVLFSGEVTRDSDPAEVRAELARALGVDERKSAQLFSGRTVVLRSQLTEAEAMQWQEKLATLGAICRIKNLAPKPSNPARFRLEASGIDATLRDITAAHMECPRCSHLQLETSHCARCGVDIAAATKQKVKEDRIIEKKLKELREKAAQDVTPAKPARKSLEHSVQPEPIYTDRHRPQNASIGQKLTGWLKR